MKKTVAIFLTLCFIITLFCGCKKKESDEKTIVIGASVTPHAEILKVAKDILKEDGYTLEIKEYNDYVLPNTALENSDIDANFFQHITYLNDFNKENGTHLVSVSKVHYEPFGIYAGKTKSIKDIKNGAVVSVPNDSTNEARALLLLEAQGLIKLKDGVGLKATKLSIVDNPKNIEIKEIEAAQIVRSLPDVDIAVINGNYAIEGGLKVRNALAVEATDSQAAEYYVNVIAVKKGNENLPKIKALKEAVESEKVREFMEETYDGAVVPLF